MPSGNGTTSPRQRLHGSQPPPSLFFPPCINGHLEDGSTESPGGVIKPQSVDTLQVRGRFGEEPTKSAEEKNPKKRFGVTGDRWMTACRVGTVKCTLVIMSSPPLLSAGCRWKTLAPTCFMSCGRVVERNLRCVSMNHEFFLHSHFEDLLEKPYEHKLSLICIKV